MVARTYSQGILTFDQRADKYRSLMSNIDTKRFTTGFSELDSVIRGVAPGEVMDIIAYSGTFKTALLQNLLNRQAQISKQYQLFFSLEMPAEKVHEREMQMFCSITGYEVENAYKRGAEERMRLNAIANGADKVLVVEEGRLNLDRMKGYVAMADTKFGAIGTVGIDYMGLMSADAKGLFEKSAELSFGIKEFAKEMNLPVVVLSQVSRAYAASKENVIETDAAKGGGDIEAGCDFMLGMFMYGGDLILRILKNRNGDTGQCFRVDIDKRSLQFLGLSPWTPPRRKSAKDEGNPFA